VADALAVINPVAGRGPGAKLRAQARAELARLIPGLAFIETDRPGHATELARGARGRLLVAVGGDGTAREVAAGLAGRADAPELALIPVGSGNDLARNLGIPADIPAAVLLAARGRARRSTSPRTGRTTGGWATTDSRDASHAGRRHGVSGNRVQAAVDANQYALPACSSVLGTYDLATGSHQ